MGTKSMGTKLDQNMPIIDIIKIQISDYYFVKWYIVLVIYLKTNEITKSFFEIHFLIKFRVFSSFQHFFLDRYFVSVLNICTFLKLAWP